jgi:CheY-like chemotaxis protein
VSFVLAISANHRDVALAQLSREVAGREFVVVASLSEALDVIERKVPDLVVFPVSMSPADEAALLQQLQQTHGEDPKRLVLPMPRFAPAGDASSRWFYWFKPASIRTANQEHAFAEGVRALIAPSPVASPVAVHPLETPSFEPEVQSPAMAFAAPAVQSEPLTLEPLAWSTEPVDMTGPGPEDAEPTLDFSTSFSGLDSDAAEQEEDNTPRIRLWDRAGSLLARGRAAASGAGEAAGPFIGRVRRWVPVAAAAGVILVAGVSVRSYWLSLVPHLEEATRRAAAATAPTARAEATPVPTTGSLSITTEPSGATVLVDGQARGTTPLTVENLPPGSHAVVLRNGEGVVERSVVVKLGETATLDASIFSGWLALFSPVEIQVYDGKRLVHVDEQNRVMLSSGRHELRFVNKTLGYEEHRVLQMKPGEVAPLTLVPPKSTISVATSVPAEVWIDGQHVGSTPVVDFPVDIGTREVILRGAGEHRLTVTATVAPVKLDVDLSTPDTTAQPTPGPGT